MHMADALLNPPVGGLMWAATALTTAYCSKKVSDGPDDRKIPLMGVLGAFVFTAQMINFAIPGTGSSGHLGGGILLAAILGPHASFLVIASVLTVQALFFADGGLLALGCNIFNLGFFPCLIAYPLVYKRITDRSRSQTAMVYAALAAAVIGLQLGSLAVVLQTWLSGVTDLSFSSFILLMQPIHLIIGIIEGIVTAGIISFVWKARPEILSKTAGEAPLGELPIRKVLTTIILATVITGGGLVLFISQNLDSLEWALERSQGSQPEKISSDIHVDLARLQDKTSVMRDYEFQEGGDRKDKSLVGLFGGLTVFLTILLFGMVLKFFRRNNDSAGGTDDT